MIWIPITLVAAGSQSVRNALQRYLKGRLSTNGAAFTRFLFGVPLATIYLALLLARGVGSLPSPGPAFWGWVVAAGLSQIVATSLTIHVMAARNFATGIAYAKTEVVQAALFEIVFLGAVVGGLGAVGIALATFAVMLMSVVKTEHPLRAVFLGWTETNALIGLLSGSFLAVSAVGFRAASISLQHPERVDGRIVHPDGRHGVPDAGHGKLSGAARSWRATTGHHPCAHGRPGAGPGLVHRPVAWFTAFTLQIAAYVRTLGLVELLFTVMNSCSTRSTSARRERS